MRRLKDVDMGEKGKYTGFQWTHELCVKNTRQIVYVALGGTPDSIEDTNGPLTAKIIDEGEDVYIDITMKDGSVLDAEATACVVTGIILSANGGVGSSPYGVTYLDSLPVGGINAHIEKATGKKCLRLKCCDREDVRLSKLQGV